MALFVGVPGLAGGGLAGGDVVAFRALGLEVLSGRAGFLPSSGRCLRPHSLVVSVQTVVMNSTRYKKWQHYVQGAFCVLILCHVSTSSYEILLDAPRTPKPCVECLHANQGARRNLFRWENIFFLCQQQMCITFKMIS